MSDEQLKKIVRCFTVIGISIAILLIEIFSTRVFFRKLDGIGRKMESDIRGRTR
ncbi:hypothetical protein [Thermotoga sp.]|uniref:hypothetical protein n=1 Tax=Thermotoga sp. TaxID=28240 RepID=UPI0025CE4D31|nr:hypothetical protein [Thermotoga sp.]MCD6550686.1 hypothetical protein [Thermotoga sp.]